jgi:hypothetical protein
MTAALPQNLELSILDRENPHSLINLVPDLVAKEMEKLPDDLLLMTEEEFEKQHKPDDLLFRLKLKFWDEWQQCLMGFKHQINLGAITYGICTKEYFYKVVIQNQEYLAWVIMPPTDYATAMQEVLYRGMARLREAVSLPFVQKIPKFYRGEPVVDPKTGEPLYETKIDRGVISEIRQLVTLLSDRVHGAVVQRAEIRELRLQANVDGSEKQILDKVMPQSALPMLSDDELTNIDDQLKYLDDVIPEIKEEDGRREEESRIIDTIEASAATYDPQTD